MKKGLSDKAMAKIAKGVIKKKTAQAVDRAKYLEQREGSEPFCPFCGSWQLDGGPVDVLVGAALQEVGCNECGGSWLDTYTISDIDILQEPT